MNKKQEGLNLLDKAITARLSAEMGGKPDLETVKQRRELLLTTLAKDMMDGYDVAVLHGFQREGNRK
jgi:hypothetical protein